MTGRLDVDATITKRRRLDVAALIRRWPERYAQLDATWYEPWERPRLLVEDVISDEHQPWGDYDDLDVGWREADWERLLAVCPETDLTPKPDDGRRPYDEPLPIGDGQ